MPGEGKVFRIFISSTFNDLKEERNALQKMVFPKLRQLCQQAGYGFQPIDLRWGIPAKAAEEHSVMGICLEEIRRCKRVTPRPNFLILLGNRYGWRPLPPFIPWDEFIVLLANVRTIDEKKLLLEWYAIDDNEVPSRCWLLPVPQLKQAEWNEKTENELRNLLESLSCNLNEDQRVKYLSSATEQEIIEGLLRVIEADHSFAFFREITNPLDISLQNNSGALAVFFDSAKNPDTSVIEPLQSCQKALLQLKTRIRERLQTRALDYECSFHDGKLQYDHLDKLCDDVYRCLKESIEKEIMLSSSADITSEETSHENFLLDRAQNFVGRENELTKIKRYLEKPDKTPLIIAGPSGSGKSALMAAAVIAARASRPDANITSRFIGVTPASADVQNLLTSCGFTLPEEDKILTSQDLLNSLKDGLTELSKDGPAFVFLDSLDQLTDARFGKSAQWIPIEIPANTCLVCSVATETPIYANIRRRFSDDNLCRISLMPDEEGKLVLEGLLKQKSRRLTPGQMEVVMHQFKQNGLPLYLRFIFDRARQWKSSEDPEPPAPDVTGVIRQLLEHLEKQHTREVVEHLLGHLMAAREGLSEEELLYKSVLKNSLYDLVLNS